MDNIKIDVSLNSIVEIQDALLVIKQDLTRLEGLLDHTSDNLFNKFLIMSNKVSELSKKQNLNGLENDLQQALTELQFHDLTTQLLTHTKKILNGCVDRLALESMEKDESEAESLVCESDILPEKPNPVVQDEMDAGSIELF